MKYLFTCMSLLLTTTHLSAQSPPEQWWSYLASYDSGPGSILLNLALRKQAPLAKYTYLVVTGPTYSSSQKQGLPDPNDLARLNGLNTKIIAAIATQSPYIEAGTFTHNFEQLHYIYVKSTAGISEALAAVYREHCKDCKTYTSIKEDPTWSAYLEFLFPNQATREHYGLQIK